MPYSDPDVDSLRARIIGLGEKSIHKSYYPELKSRLAELERFRSMLDQSSEIVFLVNYPGFQVIDVTSPVKNYLQCTPEDLIGTDFWDIVSEDIRNAQMGKISSPWYETQNQLIFTSQVRGGTPFEFFCSPVTFEGQPFVIIVAQEISQRVKSERMIRQQLFQMDTLHRIDSLITMNLSLPDLLHGVLGEVCAAMGADEAAIYIFDNPDLVECIARFGEMETIAVNKSLSSPFQFPRLHQGQHIVAGDVDEGSSHADPIGDRIRALGFTASISEPLVSHGRMKGLVEVYYHCPFPREDDLETLFTRLSAQVAVAVEKSQLFKNLERAYVDLNQAYDETLEGWAAALDLREKETSSHSQKVVDLTIQLAHAVGIKAENLVHVRRGAFLHDIGKMGIPDEILLKPGPLTDEEWAIMRQHPVMAYQMLSKIAYLQPALDIPYAHHEKWDGTGYPRGLAGPNIPLAARIFAVVDVWQALTSDRVYRKAWPKSRALNYLKDQKSTHFDPYIVDVFLKLLARSE